MENSGYPCGMSINFPRTSIGLRVKDGVVLAAEKPIHSRLLKAHSNRRIHTVELHAGVVGAGLAADCRALALRAREECSNHRETFETEIPGPMLAERLALYMQAYTMYGSVRPFCGTMLMGAVDNDGPHLYMIEPSGVCWVRNEPFLMGSSMYRDTTDVPQERGVRLPARRLKSSTWTI